MRIPQIRFTVRRLMVVVAVTTIGFWLWMEAIRAGKLAQKYRNRAAILASVERSYRIEAVRKHNEAMTFEVSLGQRRQDARDERDVRRVRRDERIAEYMKASARYVDRVADHIRDVSRKYRHAAGYPWEPLRPDPPAPGPPPKGPPSEL